MALERFSLALRAKSHVDKEGEGRRVLELVSFIINPEFGVGFAFRRAGCPVLEQVAILHQPGVVTSLAGRCEDCHSVVDAPAGGWKMDGSDFTHLWPQFPWL